MDKKIEPHECSEQIEIQAKRQQFIKDILKGVGLIILVSVLLKGGLVGEDTWLIISMLGAGYPLIRK